MKKVLLILTAIVFCSNGFAQQAFVEIGTVSTMFDYQDSDGNTVENLYPKNYFNYALGYRMPISKRFYIAGSIVHNTYGTHGSDLQRDKLYEWEVAYLGFAFDVDGEIIQKGPLRVLARAGISPQFLIRGTQILGEQVYDLKGVEQFDQPFVFFRGGAAVHYCLDGNIALTANYRYGKGFPMGGANDTESLRLNSSAFSLGILLSLGRANYCFTSHFN
jgi:hypothetical protein